jgi:hypothetical protein
MKLIAVFAVTCALCQAATAQTSECRSIADPAAKLACYDKTAAPAARPPARPQAPAIDAKKNTDGVSDEDAMVNAKLHGICRGC